MKRPLSIPLFLIVCGIPMGAQAPAAPAPIFAITQDDSKITFYVKASVSIAGRPAQ